MDKEDNSSFQYQIVGSGDRDGKISVMYTREGYGDHLRHVHIDAVHVQHEDPLVRMEGIHHAIIAAAPWSHWERESQYRNAERLSQLIGYEHRVTPQEIAQAVPAPVVTRPNPSRVVHVNVPEKPLEALSEAQVVQTIQSQTQRSPRNRSIQLDRGRADRAMEIPIHVAD